jgi:N-acyl-D-amino-acid deacylase
MRDFIFKQAQVVDGSGAEPYVADVWVRGDRIHHIAPQIDEKASETIDCAGLTLTPGFIDSHTHDDAQVLRDPAMLAKVSQGVTTVIAGNCGLSLVPLVTNEPVPPLDLLHTTQFRYPHLNDYAAAIAAARPSLNVAALIGHTALRAATMYAFDRVANADEIAEMAKHLEAAMQAGALGLSSGVFYKPAFAADQCELTALAKIVGAHAGVYVTHIRNEMDSIITAMNEAAGVAKAANTPWILSHHKCAGPANWGRSPETLAHLDALSLEQEIGLDAYPYVAGSTLLRDDLVDGVIEILITRSAPHPEMAGRYLRDIALELGVSQVEACQRLMPGGAYYFQMDEKDVRRILKHARTMIGSDGLPHDERPHPRLWGTFPRVLSHYCRDEKLFTLPEAVHKMTGLTAKRFGLVARGLIAPNHFADLVLLDMKKIRDVATFENPIQMSEGIERVMVNGEWSFANRQGTRAGSGRFLRRGE